MVAQHSVLVTSVNALKISLSNLKAYYIIVETLNIMIQLQDLQHAILSLNTNAKSLFDVLISACRGTVTSTLTDTTQLSNLLSWTRLTKGHTSLFPSSIQFYYPFLDATFTLSDIYIHIPFEVLDTFQAFNVFPFPITINDSLHSIHLPTPLILVSDDFLHIVLPTLVVTVVPTTSSPLPLSATFYITCFV